MIKTSFISIKRDSVENPEASIVIPSYNTGALIKRAVWSALAQETNIPYNIVIVDDGSVEPVQDFLEELLDDKRITIVRQDNAGISGAMNTGLSNAAKYVLRLDADDELTTDAIDVMIGKLKSEPNLSYVYADCYWMAKVEEGRWNWPIYNDVDYESLTNIWRKKDFNYEYMLTDYSAQSPLAFRNDIALSIGGFDTDFRVAEDWDFFLRMAENGDVVRIPKAMYKYYIQPKSISNNTDVSGYDKLVIEKWKKRQGAKKK